MTKANDHVIKKLKEEITNLKQRMGNQLFYVAVLFLIVFALMMNKMSGLETSLERHQRDLAMTKLELCCVKNELKSIKGQ